MREKEVKRKTNNYYKDRIIITTTNKYFKYKIIFGDDRGCRCPTHFAKTGFLNAILLLLIFVRNIVSDTYANVSYVVLCSSCVDFATKLPNALSCPHLACTYLHRCENVFCGDI